MKLVYIGQVRSFNGTIGDVIPVYRENAEIAYGLIKHSKVISAFGHENLLPLAIAELRRERPDIQWS